MQLRFFYLQMVFIALFALQAHASLEYDATKNKVLIVGPYVKYNVLSTPYSLGQYSFVTSELTLEQGVGNNGEVEVYAQWPRFFLHFGLIKVYNHQGRVLAQQKFAETEIGEDEKFAKLLLDESSAGFVDVLNEGFQFCVEQEFKKSKVQLCSNRFSSKKGTWTIAEDGPVIVKFDKKNFPKNAQISLPKKQRKVSLDIRFKGGFVLIIKDEVRHLEMKNLLIDPKEKRVGVIDGEGKVSPTRLSFKGQITSFIKENNYYINAYKGEQAWSETLTDAEMEFAPYAAGASFQLYGLVLPKSPPLSEFHINKNAPIATYMPTVEIRGQKGLDEDLRAKKKNQLLIHENNKDFIWLFPAPNKAEVNQNYISLTHKKVNYFFSSRIFRAHQSSFAASAALSTSPTLDFVPGYNFSAEHWFEELWNKNKYSFQRWGIKANVYETIQGFKPKEDYDEKLSVFPINFDILYRFSPGVKPVQSSFGLGLRYMHFKLFRSVNNDAEAGLVGVGGFWHTAPQKIVDDIFNVVPVFRYPKWMELSFFYYPLVINGNPYGFSFSWQARGQLFFAKNWYLDASFNVNNIAFQKAKVEGVTLGADAFGIGTAHGTIGFGYLFN